MYVKNRGSRLWPLKIFSTVMAMLSTLLVLVPSQSNAELGGLLYRMRNPHIVWDKSGKAAVGLSEISSQPHAAWLGGWGDDRSSAAYYVTDALSQNQVPVLVLYNLPFRDCGQASAGGAGSYDIYATWVHGVAQGIADGVNKINTQSKGAANQNLPIIVILEPDSIGLIPTADYNDSTNAKKCWTQSGSTMTPLFNPADRFNALAGAVWTLAEANYGAPVCYSKQHPDGTWYVPAHCPSFESRVKVYMDGGNAGWQASWSDVMAQRMVAAGIAGAQGFFTNSSNYQKTSDEISFGFALTNSISGLLSDTQLVCDDDSNLCSIPGKTQIIDVSRNGNGPGNFSKTADGSPYQPNGWPYWCDNEQARLGQHPTLYANNYVAEVSTKGPVSFIDALLWIKPPGETDGCWGGPSTAPNTQPNFADMKLDTSPYDQPPQQAGWPSPYVSCGLATGTWIHPAYSSQSTAVCDFKSSDTLASPKNFRITNITQKAYGAPADTVTLEWEPTPGACEYHIAALINRGTTPNESVVSTVVYANAKPIVGTNKLVFSTGTAPPTGLAPPTRYVVNPAVHGKSVEYEVQAFSCDGKKSTPWVKGANNLSLTLAFP